MSKTKTGIVVSPKGEFNHENVTEAFRLARKGGEITRHYLNWTDIETAPGEYTWSDYMINQARDAGLKLTVAFHTIRTAIKGPRPADLEDLAWDDPNLVARFSTMVIRFLARYGDLVDYLEIGSEVNAYLYHHQKDIEPYRKFFLAVRDNIKAVYPDVSVGMVFAYHTLKEDKAFSIYGRLRVGDHDGFTLYTFEDGFAHTRSPQRVFYALKEIESLTGKRPYVIEEIGWTTSTLLKGSEDEQLQAMRCMFKYLSQAPARLEFLIWFNLHDGRKQDCARIAKTFFPPDAKPEDVALFSEFLCNFGLRRNDGSEKPAWTEWIKRVGVTPIRKSI